MKLTKPEKVELTYAFALDVIRNAAFAIIAIDVGCVSNWYVGVATFIALTMIYGAIARKSE